MKRVYGPTIFAVDQECNRVYYHNSASKVKWKKYFTARYDWFRNVKCTPETQEAITLRLNYRLCEKGSTNPVEEARYELTSKETQSLVRITLK